VSTDRIIARIARELGTGDPVEGLMQRLSATDLQSLMLHIYRERSRARTPADLLCAYERSLMLQPSTADARVMAAIERTAFESAPEFEAVNLSPVLPLGLNTVLGQIDQNNCLATVRGAEVIADPTSAAALECAHRRKQGNHETIRLCSASRVLRLQPFEGAGFSPHFGIFSMVTAARDRGSLQAEFESLRSHLNVYATFLQRLQPLGFQLTDIEVLISHTGRDADLLRRANEAVLQPLASAHAGVIFHTDTTREQGRNYYKGYCIGVYAKNAAGLRMNLADGGFTDWTQRLLSNAKERLFISGLGVELLAKCFR
jgi:hypothetical protein